METPPKPKSLRMLPFVTHATRGVIRDQRMRRRAMLTVLILAVVMVTSGSTFLQAWLHPREHMMRFLLFWLGCAWLTATALLLALLDLLLVRAAGRAARRKLGENIAPRSNSRD